jgi:hypothetical protein
MGLLAGMAKMTTAARSGARLTTAAPYGACEHDSGEGGTEGEGA